MNSFEDVEQTKSRRVKLGQKVASLHQTKILHFTFTVTYFLLSKKNSPKMFPKEVLTLQHLQQLLLSVFLSLT